MRDELWCSKHDRRAHKQVAVLQEYGCFDEHTRTFVDDGLAWRGPGDYGDGAAGAGAGAGAGAALQAGHKSGQQSEFRRDPDASGPVGCADQALPFAQTPGSRSSRHAQNWRALYWRDMHCAFQCEPTERNLLWATLAEILALAAIATNFLARRRLAHHGSLPHSSRKHSSSSGSGSSVGPESVSLLPSSSSASCSAGVSSRSLLGSSSACSSSPPHDQLAHPDPDPDVLYLRHRLVSLNAGSWLIVRFARSLCFVLVHGPQVLSFSSGLLLRLVLTASLAALTYHAALDALWMADSHCRTFIWHAAINDAIVFLTATAALAATIRHMQRQAATAGNSTRTHDKN